MSAISSLEDAGKSVSSITSNNFLKKPKKTHDEPTDIDIFMKKIRKKHERRNEELEVDRFLLYDEELK